MTPRVLDWRALTLAVVAGTGCHVIGGYDQLSLRDGAKLVWARQLESEGSAAVEALGEAGSGAMLVAGTFEGSLGFGSATLTADSVSAFLALVSASGELIDWNALRTNQSGRRMAAAKQTLAGVFSDDLELGGEVLASSPNAERLFLLDVDGGALDTVRAHSFGGEGFGVGSRSVSLALDSVGNVIIGGGYEGSLEFEGCTPYPTRAKSNLFLAKLNAERNCVWAIQNVDSAPQYVESVAVDSLNDFVVAGGSFVGRIGIGEGPALQNSGGTDLFIVRLDNAGRSQWKRAFGNGLTQGGARVAAAPGGYSALVGYFEGTMDFGAGPLTASRGHDIVVANFRPSGQLEWQKQLAVDRPVCSATQCEFDDLGAAFDSEGNLVVAGVFRDAMDIEGASLSAGESSVAYFIVKFDRSGNLLWSGQFTSPTDDCLDYGGCNVALTTDSDLNVVLGGQNSGSLDFSAIEGGTSLSGAEPSPNTPQRRGFLAKFLR